MPNGRWFYLGSYKKTEHAEQAAVDIIKKNQNFYRGRLWKTEGNGVHFFKPD